MPDPLLLAIDGNSLLHRAYHSGVERDQRTVDGRPCWALSGMWTLLLDAVKVPGLGGLSVASVCANELIGIVGNSLVLPLAPGCRLDPTVESTGAAAPLRDAYLADAPEPLRVSLPTRGVFAEAEPDCEFLVLSMWDSSAERAKYRTERVERLALRAQTIADIAAIDGDVIDMESAWTV